MLNSRNMRTPRPSKKLNDRTYGPFRVLKRISLQAYKLELLNNFKVHNVFHVSMLQPRLMDTRVATHPPLVQVTDKDGEHNKWEVEEIVRSRMVRRRLKYQVKWKGYKEVTMEPAEVIQDNVPSMVKDFHTKYPFTPSP